MSSFPHTLYCFIDLGSVTQASNFENLSTDPHDLSEPETNEFHLSTLGVSTATSQSFVAHPGLRIPSIELVSHYVTYAEEANEDIHVELSAEQKKVLHAAKSHENIFFTGSAGTGKSVLLRAIISWACSVYRRDTIAITASTGIAALNIGGETIHSWAGIGIGNHPRRALYNTIIKRSMGKDSKIIEGSALWRWKECRMLVLDESEWSKYDPSLTWLI
jgi:hypothetical protein